MKRHLLTVLLFTALALPFVASTAHAAEKADAPAKAAAERKYPQGILFPYSLLDAAIVGNIDQSGSVNYLELKDNASLATFIDAISKADLTQFPTFEVELKDPKTGKTKETITTHSAELVFWINAYNACIFHTIAQQYPIKSVDKIDNFDTAKTHLIAGKKYSFEELRKKIAEFDPRALFALTTGTRGGILPARNAYRYSHLNASLDAAVRLFVNYPNNVKVNRIQNTVRVNEYFKQLNDIFSPDNSRLDWAGIRYLISAYTDDGSDQRYLTNTEYQLEFIVVSNELNDNTH